MVTIEQHVDIPLPAADAYSQATQFEALPSFLRSIDSAQQIDDLHLQVRFRDAGEAATMTFEISEQIPDKRIAWTSTGSPRCSGCLTFHRIDERSCRVMAQIEIDTEGADDGTSVRGIRQQVVDNLADFRNFLATRGRPTGRWEGSVPSPDERSGEA